jgi:hypothetical protein
LWKRIQIACSTSAFFPLPSRRPDRSLGTDPAGNLQTPAAAGLQTSRSVARRVRKGALNRVQPAGSPLAPVAVAGLTGKPGDNPMRIHKTLITAALLAIGFGAAAPSAFADTKVTVEKTGKHHYVYYADHQIYFAPETKTYYWRTDGRWVSGTELPPADRTYVTTGGVELDLDTDRPYERHEWVLAHYKDKHSHDPDGEVDD